VSHARADQAVGPEPDRQHDQLCRSTFEVEVLQFD